VPDYLHIGEHDLPPQHDRNPAEHPLSPGQLHMGGQDPDSQFPPPDIYRIPAPENQDSVPPPYADDGTASHHGDNTVIPLHSSHATAVDNYSPSTFAVDDDISTYDDLGWS
jgi:hypothetical protein